MAPMGDAAPAFSSTTELGTVPGFIVGRWCMISMASGGVPDPQRYFEFKSDGTFETGNAHNEWKSTGRWTEANGTVSLAYETMNGKTLEAFQAEYKKDEEGGGQVSVQRALLYDAVYDEIAKLNTLHVDQDGQHLAFGGAPAPSTDNAMGGQGEAFNDMLKMASTTLQRMGPKKVE